MTEPFFGMGWRVLRDRPFLGMGSFVTYARCTHARTHVLTDLIGEGARELTFTRTQLRFLNLLRAASTRRLRRLPPAPSPRPCAFLPMPSNPHKHRSRAIYDSFTRCCAEQASEHVLETAEPSQILSPGAELPPHLVRHNWCVTFTIMPVLR